MEVINVNYGFSIVPDWTNYGICFGDVALFLLSLTLVLTISLTIEKDFGSFKDSSMNQNILMLQVFEVDSQIVALVINYFKMDISKYKIIISEYSDYSYHILKTPKKCG